MFTNSAPTTILCSVFVPNYEAQIDPRAKVIPCGWRTFHERQMCNKNANGRINYVAGGLCNVIGSANLVLNKV